MLTMVMCRKDIEVSRCCCRGDDRAVAAREVATTNAEMFQASSPSDLLANT